jgi:YidC/Oxa1 family membrane protein insertase
MDYIKYALIAGLAAVSYLLLLAWQEDYPPVTNQAENAVENPAVLPADSQNLPIGGDMPTAPADNVASSNASSDIPSVGSNPAANAQANQEVSERLISVSTDVLNIQIDPLGGDIVFVSLPEYATSLETPDTPFVLLENSSGRTYVAQNGVIGRDGIDGGSQRPMYTSTQSSYTLGPNQNSLSVVLSYDQGNGVSVNKTFTFRRGDYLIDIGIDVNNQGSSTWQGNLFAQIKRNNFADPTSGTSFGKSSYLGYATTTPDDNYSKVEFDDIQETSPSHSITGGWVALSQHYFMSAFVPPSDNQNNFNFRQNNQGEFIGGFTSSAFNVEPGQQANQQMQFYAGPKDQDRLKEIAPWLDRTINYGFLWFIASPIHTLLTLINSFVGNFGWSILILTLIVKAVFFKLSATSYRSMANMRRVMPKMNQLKERYGDDKMKLQKETMELYRKEKINPFGGCLPMLVQMPVFIALYWVLMEGVELRHAPWILWINDLSVMDPYFVLPLLMGASMYVQFMLNPTPQDPMQAKVMKFMPIGMTIFFLWFPAGLVLYWLANSVLGIAQQYYVTRKIESEFAAREAAKS